MKHIKAFGLTLLLLLVAREGFAQDTTSAQWLINNTDREVLAVEVVGAQAQPGTNERPPRVSLKVTRIAKLFAGQPYGGQFTVGGDKPGAGAVLDDVVWNYDLLRGEQLRQSGGRQAFDDFMQETLAAPAVGSNWLVLLRRNDEGHYEVDGTYRDLFSEEKFTEYVDMLGADQLPPGVREGDADLITGSGDEILHVNVMANGRLMVLQTLRGNRQQSSTLQTDWSDAMPGEQWVVMGHMADDGLFQVDPRVRYPYVLDVTAWVQRLVGH
ncbi:MAG: hypothetical protein AB7S38_15765 [Vulcanimicrobiota bacterium]